MESKFKKPAIVFLVLNTIFLLVWVAMLAVFGLTSGLYADFVQDFLMGAHVNPIINVFTKFNFAHWKTYVLLAIAAIGVIMLIVGIILSITRKRKRYIFYILSFLLSIAAAIDFFANAGVYYRAIFNQTIAGKHLAALGIFYMVAIVASAAIAYGSHFLVYFLGLAHAKALKKAAELQEVAPAEEPAQIEEQPSEENNEAPAEDEEEDFALAAVNNEPQAVEEVKEEAVEEQPLADFAVEPEELPAQPEEVVVEEVPQETDPEKTPVTRQDLASILKDVVRDIVRDEIARANADKEEEKKDERPQFNGNGGFPSVTGATFGGPLVVQYFNGGINAPAEPAVAPAPAPAPAPKEEPKPAEEPKQEEPEPKKEEPEPAPAPAPQAVEPVLGPVVEEKPKNPIIRIPFTERLLDSEQDIQDIYNELKNELLSWGLHSRVSNSGDAFRLHTKTYCKITVAGKSLKLYFALDPADYSDSTLPIQDASEKGLYVDIPLVFKVKSGLSVRRAKQLIKDACEKDGLTQEEVGTVNWIKELKAERKAKK